MILGIGWAAGMVNWMKGIKQLMALRAVFSPFCCVPCMVHVGEQECGLGAPLAVWRSIVGGRSGRGGVTLQMVSELLILCYRQNRFLYLTIIYSLTESSYNTSSSSSELDSLD